MGCPGWFSLSKRIFTETDFYDDNSSLADLVVSGGVLPPGRGVRIQLFPNTIRGCSRGYLR